MEMACLNVLDQKCKKLQLFNLITSCWCGGVVVGAVDVL